MGRVVRPGGAKGADRIELLTAGELRVPGHPPLIRVISVIRGSNFRFEDDPFCPDFSLTPIETDD